MTQPTLSGTRRYRRIFLPTGMFVAWYGGGAQSIGRVKTLGMGGLFLADASPPPVNTRLRLSFEVPGGSVHAEAIVRSVTPGEGMGLEFLKTGARERILLERLLRRLLQEIPE